MQTVSKIKIGSSGAVANLQDTVSNYTAFEVFAHDYDIPVGECAELGGYVNVAISASMTHNMCIRTKCVDSNNCDVVVDWGDGTIVSVKNKQYNTDASNAVYNKESDIAKGKMNYGFSHTYKSSGKYVVKIYGKDYYNIMNELSLESGETLKGSLMCRVFTSELPLAPHVLNLTKFCANSPRLLYVNAETIKRNGISNIFNLFAECRNLIEAVNFEYYFTQASCGGAFINCVSLKKTDLQLPVRSFDRTSASQIYYNCKSLEVDIDKLIPDTSMLCIKSFSMNYAFYNTQKLTGTVPADRLWGNKAINWGTTVGCFKDSSEKIRSQVPTSWSGTADDSIIESSPSEKIAQLQQQVQELIQRIETLEQNK